MMEKQREQNPRHQQPVNNDHENMTLPVERVGLFSYLTYTWLDSFMWKAFRHGIDGQRLWTCPHRDTAQVNASRLDVLWKEELARTDMPSLWRVSLRYVRRRLLLATSILMLSFLFLFVAVAYLLMSVLEFCQREDEQLWRGLLLVVLLFFGNMLHSVFFVCVFTITHAAASRLRSGLLMMLYRKLLRIQSFPDKTAGQVLDLFVNDSQRIFDGITYLPMLAAAPVLGIASTAYAMHLLGIWPLIGFFILCLMFPLQMLIGKAIMHFREKTVQATDLRVHLMNEILTHVKFLKVYAWEDYLSERVSECRAKEKTLLERVNLSMSFGFIASSVLISIATMVTLVVYALLGNNLTAVQAFTYLIIYSSIQEKLQMGMISVKCLSEFGVTCNRLQDVLLAEEIIPTETSKDCITSTDAESDYIIKINNASLSWPGTFTERDDGDTAPVSIRRIKKDEPADETEPINTWVDNIHNDDEETKVLSNINLSVKKGELLGVAGPIGSGKSALLLTILGEMRLLEGDVKIIGKLTYAPQKPWIFSGSIKDNIIFNEPYNATDYHTVLEACRLSADLSRLTEADQSRTAGNDTALSGGQKQRLSVARAIYRPADIYVLDDPLVSLDGNVSASMYNDVIRGILSGKTVVMVTHHMQHLTNCDRIVYMQHGSIESTGTHTELIEKNENYAEFIQLLAKCHSHEGHAKLETMTNQTSVRSYETKDESNDDIPGTNNRLIDSSTDEPSTTNDDDDDRDVGAVTLSTYLVYMRAAGGIPAILMVLLVSVLAEASRAFSHWWLATWLEHGGRQPEESSTNMTRPSDAIANNSHVHFYIRIYGMSLLAIVILFVLRSVVIIKILVHATSVLHARLLDKVMASPMSFFNTTPMCRIMNRFSKDMDEVDCRLPPMADGCLRTALSIIIHFAIIVVILHWFAVAALPILAIFIFLYALLRAGARETKRLQNSSVSPLLGHVTDTLHGMSSVRVFQKQHHFEKRFANLLDHNTVTVLLFNLCSRWINIRINLIAALIVCLTALLVVLMKNSVQTGFAGVVIIYAAQLTSLFQMFVRHAVETEARFTSVERIASYLKNLTTERLGADHQQTTLPDAWPTKGHLKLTNYSMRYNENLPLAVHDVTCEIQPGEKVAIVGRTGAGKSSLAMSMFRLSDNTEGTIEIDGVNIKTVGLGDLRSKLSLIPQDPVLFSGTIRSNLDPFHHHSDSDIWKALSHCHMQQLVSNMTGQLSAEVTTNGDNLSTGQRQLLCLSRVFLRRSKVVILDEVTASMDAQTEHLITDALKSAFSGSTVLAICHRLSTALKYDKIMVIDKGQLLEFDTVPSLLSDPGSRLYRMIRDQTIHSASLSANEKQNDVQT